MNRIMSISTLALLIVGLFGCVAPAPMLTSHTCDWCNTSFRVVGPGTRIAGPSEDGGTLVIVGTGYETTRYSLHGPIYDRAIADTEGHTFCSLRCLNAYKASTDIKEKRFRVIQGE